MILICSLPVLFILSAIVIWRSFLGSARHDADRMESLLSDEPVSNRYRPMERLLRQSDLTFLTSQAGLSASALRKARARRRAIFRSYLSSVSEDFSSISLIVRAIMVQSTVDRSDLAASLAQARRLFFQSWLRIQFQLALHACGVSELHFEISPLTRSLDEICMQVRAIQTNPDLSPSY